VELIQIVEDVARALVAIDSSGIAFRHFQPGVGPYGEPQLLRQVVHELGETDAYAGKIKTCRTPDVLITSEWMLEFKIARPFGDNGEVAENGQLICYTLTRAMSAQ